MLNVSTDVKNVFDKDVVPGTFKFYIDSDEYTAEHIKSGSLNIVESLCSGDDIDFSDVNKSELNVTLGNLNQSIKDLLGKKIIFTEEINTTSETLPLGVYTIVDSSNDGDYMIRIKAFDNLQLFDIDVSDWWNNEVEFPLTIRELLISLCDYCNADYAFPTSFVNSSFSLNKTIELTNVSGLEILGYIQQATASFIKADRNGIIKMITFPTSDFDTTEICAEYTTGKIISSEIADYTVEPLSGVKIRNTEDDIGVMAGTSDNVYIIESNPLFYNFVGDTDEQQVAQNIFNAIKYISYIPVNGNFKALHYIECGDLIRIHTFKNKIVNVPLLYRELSGVGLIRDRFEIDGQQYHTTVITVDKSIKVLNRRSHEFSVTLDEFRSEIDGIVSLIDFRDYYFLSTSDERIEDTYLYFSNSTRFGEKTFFRYPWGGDWTDVQPDLMPGHWLWTKIKKVWSNGDIEWTEPVLESLINRNYAYTIMTNSELQQTNELLKLKVSYDEYNKNNENIDSRFSSIEQTADGIILEVSRKVGEDEIISKINQSPEQVQINANRIKLTGDVYISSSDSSTVNSNVRINKGVITTYDSYGQTGAKLYSQRLDIYSWRTDTENDRIGSLTASESGSGDDVNKTIYLIGDNGWDAAIGISAEGGVLPALRVDGETGSLTLNNARISDADINSRIYLSPTGTSIFVDNNSRLNISSTWTTLWSPDGVANVFLGDGETGGYFYVYESHKSRLSITADTSTLSGVSSQYIRLRDSDGIIIANDDSGSYIWLSTTGKIQIKTNGTAHSLEWYTTGGKTYLVSA